MKIASNFLNNLDKISKDNILEKAKNVPNLDNNIVFNHYIYLLEFTKESICENNLVELIGLIHMCYGWMPTMYDDSNISLYKNNEFINDIWKNINSGSLDIFFLNKLKTITNNSIVGASKLLHFCNPQMYAIYDSRIYCSVSNNRTTTGVNNVNYFIEYIKKSRELVKDLKFVNNLREILINKNPVITNFSDLRCIEMCFFYK